MRRTSGSFPAGGDQWIQHHVDGGIMESLSKELSGIEIKMNRLLARKATLKNRLKKIANEKPEPVRLFSSEDF